MRIAPANRWTLPSLDPTARLVRVFGIQLTATWSWLVLAAFSIYVGVRELPRFVPHLGPQPAEVWAVVLSSVLLAMAALYAHEIAHALVGRRFGLSTRTIGLSIIGGNTHLGREAPSAGAEVLIALSGPATSLLIGVVAALAAVGLTESAPLMALVAVWLAAVNIPLAVFNLLPAYPLDGGRILRACVWFASEDPVWSSAVAARAGQAAALLLAVGAGYSLTLGVDGLPGMVWLALVAWYVYMNGLTAHRTTLFLHSLRGLNVARLQPAGVQSIEADRTLQSIAEEQFPLLRPSQPWPVFAVYEGTSWAGLLALADLRKVPRDRWRVATAREAMQAAEEIAAVAPETPAVLALQVLIDEGLEHLPVVADGRLLGLLRRADLVRAVGQQADRSALR